MKDWDQLDVIQGMLGLTEVNLNRFVSDILDTSSVFPKAFSQCTTGLANILTWESGILFYATFAID